MEKLGNSKYNFYVIAPFNSRMVFDYSTLIGKYEKIRKRLYIKLDKIYPNQVLIEKFKDNADPNESIKNWANEREKVIHGEMDRVIPVENGRILASRIPSAELVIFENAGHALDGAGSKPGETVLAFIKRQSQKG